ncbi:MAG TPA: alpha/beta fold hydrolase [Cryptosporangiaceae bacterium]|nr:alpha/beta fold hydrolase [Cryptosporangiaceae bacterium]
MSQISTHRGVARRLDLSDGSVGVLDSLPARGVPARATALLVPGYTGSKEDFVPLLDPLADAGYRVVAMDQPGQYESVGPDDHAAYTVDWLGTVVCGVVKELDAGAVHLLGHSFGGLVARAAALAEPALFRSLTLMGSGPAALGGSRRERMAALEPLVPRGMAVVYDAVERLAAGDPRWRQSPAELRAFLKARFVASSAAGLLGMGNALLSEPDRVAGLAAAGIPVLVCHGVDDDAWRPVTQAEMARRLGATHVAIPAAVHSPAIENTAATVATLREFWRQHDRAPSLQVPYSPAPAGRAAGVEGHERL